MQNTDNYRHGKFFFGPGGLGESIFTNPNYHQADRFQKKGVIGS